MNYSFELLGSLLTSWAFGASGPNELFDTLPPSRPRVIWPKTLSKETFQILYSFGWILVLVKNLSQQISPKKYPFWLKREMDILIFLLVRVEVIAIMTFLLKCHVSIHASTSLFSSFNFLRSTWPTTHQLPQLINIRLTCDCPLSTISSTSFQTFGFLIL